MDNSYCMKDGENIDLIDFKIPMAKECANFLEKGINPYYNLVEIKSYEQEEIIIFDMDLEIPQKRKFDIRNRERLSITFCEGCLPIVEALRKDFPQISHLNITSQEVPKNLCLFEKPFEELEHTLNAPKLLGQICYWLECSSMGMLHDADQPLEPIMLNTYNYIFLPNNFGEVIDSLIFKVIEYQHKKMLVPYKKDCLEQDNTDKSLEFYLPLLVHADPQEHGHILKVPTNIEVLKSICQKWGINLVSKISDLINKLLKVQLEEYYKNIFYESNLLIIISVPKTRYKETETESYEYHSFFSGMSIREISNHLGISEKYNGFQGIVLGEKNENCLANIKINHLNVSFLLSRSLAAQYNNSQQQKKNILAIGAGSLGSYILTNLTRAGIGVLNIIDDDWLLPHNLARHILAGRDIGKNKAEALSSLLNSLLDEGEVSKGYCLNVLKHKEQLESVIEEAEIILDMSTSLAVERYLAIDCINTSKKISIFLSPSGKDLVILAEDKERKARLDWIEMQYYRYIISKRELKSHISEYPGDIRYSRSCRDISNRIPNDYISIHAAIASNILKDLIEDDKPKIVISRFDTKNNDVNTAVYKCHENIRYEVKGWEIYTDKRFIENLTLKREEKLPAETGGVILGSFDFKRKIIYMVDIYCPEDSIEYPTAFIRGCSGLEEKLEEISKSTAGNIEYVGEWHSHPNNCSVAMSKDDKDLLNYLCEGRKLEGYPGVVVIIGDRNKGLSINVSSTN